VSGGWTPGPWTAHVPNSAENLPFVLTSDGGDPLQPETLSEPNQVEANARLIAAAPELYEALAEFVAYLDAGTGTLSHELEYAMRDALAKARGDA
jgi:hypothetical protein